MFPGRGFGTRGEAGQEGWGAFWSGRGLRGSSGGLRLNSDGRCRYVCGAARVEGADVRTFLANHAHGGQAGDVVVLLEENRQNFAFNLRRFVKRGLVRLVTEQVVSNRDPVPHSLVPRPNHTTLDRLPLPRHDYRRCQHDLFL